MLFTPQSDHALVAKALKGNARAWEKLIKRYERPIYQFALRMTGNREDSMDLLQEIFLSLFRNLGSFREDGHFKSWLYRIASCRITDHYRRRKPTEHLADDHLLPSDARTGPHLALVRGEINRNLLDLLQQLPEEQRLVVELKFFQEMTFEEISALLEISSNTLKSRLYAALKKMRTMTEVIHAL